MFVNNEITERGLLHRLLEPRRATRSRSTSATSWAHSIDGAINDAATARTSRCATASPARSSCSPRPRRSSAVAAALRDEDVVVSREALDAVRAFMTDGIDSPLYGGDPLAARRAADALRRALAGSGEPRDRRVGRLRFPPGRSGQRLLNLLSSLPRKRAAPPAPPASRMRGMTELWGAETRKAIDNFPVSGRPIPVGVVRWLGRIKAAAARVNADLGLLDAELAQRIAAAGDAIAAGEHDDQFPIDVFQTGSGTSSNMNANEVMADARRRRRAPERPRQPRPVVERRLPVGGAPGGARCRDERPAARARRARGGARGEGRGLRRTSSRPAARISWTPCP